MPIILLNSNSFNVESASVTEWGDITGTLSNQTDLQTELDSKINISEKGALNGVATLDNNGKLPANQMPYEAFQYRGELQSGDDLTSNTSSNSYVNSTTEYSTGDLFIASNNGNIIVSDGTIDIVDGDTIIINTIVNKSNIIVNNIDVNLSTPSASQIPNTPSGNILSTNVQDAIDELDLNKVEKSTLTTKGDIFVRNSTDIVRLPIGNDGYVLKANSSNPNGLEWGSSDSIPNSHVIYRLTSNVTTHTFNDDHCKFDTTLTNIDPLNLQTLGISTYTTTVGINCIGRVLLQSGYYYKITGYISTLANSSFLGFSIYDVTTASTRIGTRGSTFARTDQDANIDSMASFAFLQANNNRIVELRKTGGTLNTWYSGNNNLSECFMIIEVIGVI